MLALAYQGTIAKPAHFQKLTIGIPAAKHWCCKTLVLQNTNSTKHELCKILQNKERPTIVNLSPNF
ncbi:hypothetical protein [Alkalinema sp. FACHB-956]|uniref:hypothetical protein n=1 Tax=Alkalinema sp. FACHB-956 TaxID=2692768 RepID=UPI0016893CB5|nr:hypothetical protein [Alkalinema sp. FACHB-956]MBD2325500.1 hypothetical protein [Alkalinema sp. FACHB-956]